eukprot:TRINITY_DN6035_c2_g7_i1.p2 TRINITY_DN6035_c2_g7~~TRINITY_DN6035_c2_g7_i1.p2  ORF type:complete len:362 (+),score=99.68 TRINITY_DN6035_c2_g7_i1:99-1088(+)
MGCEGSKQRHQGVRPPPPPASPGAPAPPAPAPHYGRRMSVDDDVQPVDRRPSGVPASPVPPPDPAPAPLQAAAGPEPDYPPAPPAGLLVARPVSPVQAMHADPVLPAGEPVVNGVIVPGDPEAAAAVQRATAAAAAAERRSRRSRRAVEREARQQQQQQQEAAEEAFRAEWDAKLKELARNPAEDAVLTIPKKGLTFAREQLVRDLCSRHGVRFDSQGSTREAVCVRTQASYAAIYGHQTPPQPATIVGAKVLREGGSAVGTPQSSPGISPAFHPTDRAVLRQAHGVAVVHARGPFDAVPFPQGRGRPLHKQPSPPQRPADIGGCDERA